MWWSIENSKYIAYLCIYIGRYILRCHNSTEISPEKYAKSRLRRLQQLNKCTLPVWWLWNSKRITILIHIHIHMCKLFPHALHSFILYSICCYLPSDFIETFYTLRFILEACGKLQATTTKWLTAFWKRCTFFMQRSIYIGHTYTYNLETFYGIFSHSVSFMLLLLHLLNTLGGSLFAKFFEYMYIYIFF